MAVLADGLIFDDMLPLVWTPGPLPDDMALARLNAENQQTLMADSTLDEVRGHDALKDQSPALVHELQRLDFKLNILLRLTAEMAMRHNGLPPASRVRFTASQLEWSGENAPAAGPGVLMLYVNPSLPQPLRIAARAIDASHNDVRLTRLEFTGMSELVVELIEKLIFRHHRRLVAGARIAPHRTP